ncbi:carboxymuconolactone decarboxylase family protein [Micromonospora chersina]
MNSPAAFLTDPPLSPAVTAAYEGDLTSDGYVNNLTRVWCWRPDVLASFQAVRADLLAGSALSPREVAVLVAATAAARGDAYCALAWGARLADLSDEATAAQVLRGADGDLSERENALAAWSRQVVRDPNAATEAQVERLRDAGLGDQEIFEATTLIAFRLAFSTVNDALGARPDPQLAEKAPRLVREAVTFGRPVQAPTTPALTDSGAG